MANNIITITGQNKILNAITSSSSVQFRYFKVSATNYDLDPTLTDLSDAWLTKEITSWLIVDDNTLIINCYITKLESADQATIFGIYDSEGDLIFLGKPDTPFPPGNEIVFTFEIQFPNLGTVADFSLLPWNDSELYLLVTDISTQLSNEISDIHGKLTDAKLEIDNINDKLDTILNGTPYIQPYKTGNNNTITFVNSNEQGIWKFDLVCNTEGNGPIAIYFNTDKVVEIDNCCGGVIPVTFPVIYEITSIPTTITITTENCSLQYYTGFKLLA